MTGPRYGVRHQDGWPEGLEQLLEDFEVIEAAGWYREEVEGGRLVLAMLTDSRSDGRVVDLCHLLFRLEHIGDRLEFVAVACVAVDPHNRQGDLTAALVQACEPLALSQGCTSLRVHTARPGLVLKLSNHGFSTIETVMQKHLQGAV